jgi:hypothetical protein
MEKAAWTVGVADVEALAETGATLPVDTGLKTMLDTTFAPIDMVQFWTS